MAGIKILFCDVDGVLNSHKDYSFGDVNKPAEVDVLNEDNCNLLKHVLNETGAFVVISSTWRKDDGFLAHKGIESGWRKLLSRKVVTKEQLGWNSEHHFDFKTPVLSSGKRGEEIQRWLDTYGKRCSVERFAIVDDDSDMLKEQLPFFVKTSMNTGLTQVEANKLINILNS